MAKRTTTPTQTKTYCPDCDTSYAIGSEHSVTDCVAAADNKKAEYIEYVKRNVAHMIDARLAVQAEFASKITAPDADLMYLWTWSANVMKAGVEVTILKGLQAVVNEHGLTAAITEAKELVMRAARWPGRSTSVASNEVESYKGQCAAEFIADFGRYDR